jgi:hypothetical protein
MRGIDLDTAPREEKPQPAGVFPYVMLSLFGAALCVLFYRFMLLPRSESDGALPVPPDIVLLLRWLFP